MRSTSWTEGPAPRVDTLIMSLMVRCGEEDAGMLSVSKGSVSGSSVWIEGVSMDARPLRLDRLEGVESWRRGGVKGSGVRVFALDFCWREEEGRRAVSSNMRSRGEKGVSVTPPPPVVLRGLPGRRL